jgi:poly(A) polymerase
MALDIGTWHYKYLMLTEKLVNLDIDTDEFERLWTPAVKRTAEILNKYGFALRVVGGAVRDFLQKEPARDIDFATDADPSELIYIFNEEGVPHDDKGIGHGTIKAVFGNEKIDVTSITYKLEQQDGKIRIVRGRDWEQDAQNRDLSINSMSVDHDGTLYDYTGGLVDLRNHTVRMLPHTRDRLAQDPHLIMRWYKAISAWPNANWPRGDYAAISQHIPDLAQIKSDEKTDREISSIIRGKNGHKVLELMCRMGAGGYLGIDCNLD